MSLIRCLIFADPAFVAKITPPPLFAIPDLEFTEQFDADWEAIPPNPQFDPPDVTYTEQFDANWDDVP